MSGMNIVLAILHQAVGAFVLAATTWGAHVIGRRQ
jgi:cytochrome c oxidase assembly protein subunit 15